MGCGRPSYALTWRRFARPRTQAARPSKESTMAEHPTQVLARFAATLDYERIPPQAREYCKNLLLDALACAVAGHQGEETGQVEAFAGALAQSNESSIIGGDRLSLA